MVSHVKWLISTINKHTCTLFTYSFSCGFLRKPTIFSLTVDRVFLFSLCKDDTKICPILKRVLSTRKKQLKTQNCRPDCLDHVASSPTSLRMGCYSLGIWSMAMTCGLRLTLQVGGSSPVWGYEPSGKTLLSISRVCPSLIINAINSWALPRKKVLKIQLCETRLSAL